MDPTPLTLAGFIGLGTLAIASLGLVIGQIRRSTDLRERIVRLEEELRHHLENGNRHQR